MFILGPFENPIWSQMFPGGVSEGSPRGLRAKLVPSASWSSLGSAMKDWKCPECRDTSKCAQCGAVIPSRTVGPKRRDAEDLQRSACTKKVGVSPNVSAYPDEKCCVVAGKTYCHPPLTASADARILLCRGWGGGLKASVGARALATYVTCSFLSTLAARSNEPWASSAFPRFRWAVLALPVCQAGGLPLFSARGGHRALTILRGPC